MFTINQLAPRFVRRLKEDKDLVIAVTGDEGSGNLFSMTHYE